jgi:hypothetical protein
MAEEITKEYLQKRMLAEKTLSLKQDREIKAKAYIKRADINAMLAERLKVFNESLDMLSTQLPEILEGKTVGEMSEIIREFVNEIVNNYATEASEMVER